MPEAILFDLDGTLIDTAPDMAQALNNLLVEENLDPLPFETLQALCFSRWFETNHYRL